MIDETLLEAEEKMEKAVEVAKDDFAAIRTGRAQPAMFSKIFVDYYGSRPRSRSSPRSTCPRPRMVARLAVRQELDDARSRRRIRDSDLGVNPSNDGNVIRVVFPQLTEERRKDYIKVARHKAEDARISMRNIRRHAKDDLDKLVKDGEAGEDEVRRAEKELDDLTHKYVDADRRPAQAQGGRAARGLMDLVLDLP